MEPQSHSHPTPTLLTPCSRFPLEKLTGFQLIKKFSAFYATRKFISAVTRARQLPILSQLDPFHTPHIPLPKDPS